MLNLKTPLKKWNFNPLNLIAIIIISFMIYEGIGMYIEHLYQKWEVKQEQLIRQYELKIDSVALENNTLILQIYALGDSVDSLKNVKSKIIYKYVKETSNIHNAPAESHAKWLQSKLDSLKKQPGYNH